MVTADIAENNLVELLKEFDIFERNEVSIEIKLAAIAMYILSSSLRNSSSLKLGNQFIRIEKFKDSLESEGRKEVKRLVIARIAVDETSKDGMKCYLFAAID